MTCKEKLINDHPNWSMEEIEEIVGIECPELFEYLPDPEYCKGDEPDCVRCWNREIPESARIDDTSEMDKLRFENETYRKTIEAMRIELIRCNAIIRTAEQFGGVRLPKVKMDF